MISSEGSSGFDESGSPPGRTGDGTESDPLAVDLAPVLERIDLLAAELDSDAVSRSILELVRAVDQKPVLDRLDSLRRLVAKSRPAEEGTPSLSTADQMADLTAEVKRLRSTLQRHVLERLERLVDSVDTETIVRELSANQWPLVDRMEEIAAAIRSGAAPGSGLEPAGGGVGGLEVMDAIADLRATIERSIADRMDQLKAALDPKALAKELSVTQWPVVDKVERLFQAAQVVLADDRYQLGGMTSELSAIREQLSAAPTGTDLQALGDRLAALAGGGEDAASLREALAGLSTADDVASLREALAGLPKGEDLEVLRDRLSGLPTTSDLRTIFEALLELKGRIDGPVLERLIDLRQSAGTRELQADLRSLAEKVDLGPVLDKLETLPRDLDLKPVMERMDSLATTADLFPVLDRINGVVKTVGDSPALKRIADVLESFHPASVLEGIEQIKEAVDLGPVLSELWALRTDLRGIADLRKALDEGPLAESLEQLTTAFDRADIQNMLQEIKAHVEASDVGDEVRALPDLVLGPVLERIEDLSARIDPEAIGLKLDQIAAVRDEIVSLRATLTEGPLAELLERLVDASDQTEVLDALAEIRGAADLHPVLERIDSIAEVDLHPVLERIDEVARAADPARVLEEIVSLRTALTKGPMADLLQELVRSNDQSPVLEGLAELREEVANRPESDTAEVLARIDDLKEQLGYTAVHEEVRALPSMVLKPVLARLDALANAVLEQADVRDRLGGLSEGLGDLSDGLDQLRAAVGETALEQLDGVAAQMETLQVTLEKLPGLLADAVTDAFSALEPRLAEIEEAARSGGEPSQPAVAEWSESEAAGPVDAVNERLEAMEARIDTLIDAVLTRLDDADAAPAPAGLAEMELQMAEMAAAVTALRKRVTLRGRMDSAALDEDAVELIAEAVTRRLNPAPASGSKRRRRRAEEAD